MRYRLTALALALGLLAPGALCPAQQPLQPPGLPGGIGPGGGIRPGLDYKEMVPPLIDALKDADPDVRQSAASALAAIGAPAVGPLLDVVKGKDEDKALRANAVYVLGHMGGAAHEAVPALLKLLKDSDTDVRRRAAYALQLIVKESPSGPGGMPGMGGPGAMMGMMGGRPAGHSNLKVTDPGLVLQGNPPPAPPATKGAETKEEKKESK